MKNCDLKTPAVLNSLFVAYASSWVRRRKRLGGGGWGAGWGSSCDSYMKGGYLT